MWSLNPEHCIKTMIERDLWSDYLGKGQEHFHKKGRQRILMQVALFPPKYLLQNISALGKYSLGELIYTTVQSDLQILREECIS